jgi:phosphate transport system substrate-binding protein
MMARAFHLLLAGALLSAITHAAPPRFARLGSFEGQVEVELDPADSWRPATSNLPLPESTRIHTGPNAKVEIEFDDASVFRMVGEAMAEISDYTRLSGGQRILVISLDHGLAYFTGEPGPADAIHLLVPGAQTMLKQGSRIRLQALDNSSEIAIVEGSARFTIPTAEMDLRQGQSARVTVPDSSHFSLYREIAPLQPDTWNEQLDKAEADSPASTLDLDRSGKWIADGDYGTIWQPPPQAGWAPFRQGRWVWYQSIGFTWVAAETWGWRPYHEGRWLQHRNLGWVWIPAAADSSFSPGDVFWARANGQALWGPLAPSEQWTGVGPPKQFALLNVTGGVFVSGAREILPSPAEDLPKDLLKAFLFAPALPSPSLPVARLNVIREGLRTRLYSAVSVTPDVPVTRATPPPPDEPPVVAEVIAPPAALPTAVRDPDPVVSDTPVGPMVPGIIAITVPNRTGGKTTGKTSTPAKATTTYVAAIPPNLVALNGIGPSATAPLYDHWFEKFNLARMTYQPLGAGRGLSDLKDGRIDFAASDSPVTDTQFLQFPTAVTGVVPIYNLPGVTDRLRLTADVLAAIFLGEIRYWNDHRIVELNPRAGLPPAPITVVISWSASQSTYAWTDYLSKTSSAWKARMGDAVLTMSGPVNAFGVKGEQAAADMIQHTPYSLGYADYAVAVKNKMATAAVRNKAGVFVFAEHETLTEAATSLEPTAESGGSHAYPIASFTYLLLPKRSFDQTKRPAMIAFLKWMLTDGQKDVADFGYAPLPEKVLEREQQQVYRMRGQ